MISRFAPHLIGLALCLQLTGCAENPYKDFYREEAVNSQDWIAELREAPAPITPVMQRVTGNMQDAYALWQRKSYQAYGTSRFNSSGTFADTLAIAQGKAVKADVVLIQQPQHTGTLQTSKEVISPSVTTAQIGTLSATSYTMDTQYVPVTEQRFDYLAVYMIKVPVVFGVMLQDLTDKERSERQTNVGVKARVVIDDSPAFRADLMVDDIIERFDGQPVSNTRQLQELYAAKAGQRVSMTVSRKGKVLEKEVLLNPARR